MLRREKPRMNILNFVCFVYTSILVKERNGIHLCDIIFLYFNYTYGTYIHTKHYIRMAQAHVQRVSNTLRQVDTYKSYAPNLLDIQSISGLCNNLVKTSIH